MRLKNKIALITGSGSGIGQATAARFTEEAACVVVADIDRNAGEQTVAQLRSSGGKTAFCEADLSNEAGARAAVDMAVSEFGGLDILVNNAGVFVLGSVEELGEADWDRAWAINVKGYAYCAKQSVPEMRKRGGGAIVNLGSISSFVAQPGFVPYNATKGAVLQLTRCMAMDFAADNVRVNCVCPGAIDTPSIDRIAAHRGVSRVGIVEQLKRLHFTKRLGTPREVANAILFLVSDEASFITATPLMVDGGYCAQ